MMNYQGLWAAVIQQLVLNSSIVTHSVGYLKILQEQEES